MRYKSTLKVMALAVGIGIPLLLSFNNCSSDVSEEAAQNSAAGDCQLAPANLRNPSSIEGTMQLINSLPKPVTLPCFFANFNTPLNVFAIGSSFSAQPASSPDSPRIFVIRPAFILSVVPTGLGKDLLEMSQYISLSASVKAEIEFPVRSVVPNDTPFTHIRAGNGGTTCQFCHVNEVRATDFGPDAFSSAILRPDPFNRVPSSTLRQTAANCNRNADPFRCDLLQAIFITGQARDANFP